MITLLLALAGGTPDALPSLSESLTQPETLVVQDEEPPKGWTGSVSVGGLLSKGNSEQRGANATADAELRRDNDRTSLGFTWLYDENKNNPTNDYMLVDRKTVGIAQYDYFLTEKTYALAQGRAEADFQAALDLRYNAGVGIGHQFREEEGFKLGGEVGLTYISEEFATGQENDYVSARIAYAVEWAVSESWFLQQNAEAFPSVEDGDDILVKVDTRVQANLSEAMFAQLQYLFDYDNTPATGAERDDHRFLLSVGWKF